ncbi:DeoR/GlpR transcriptional regulator [Arthrobacter echini]|uniref:DeoR/GlpR transcriptional regulator n=1 Tax=Arthrobacter echini TaxID=1529066 RepID=A0A4S5E6R3_9MICC|nr:DeoR/GlpR family DNA-binding transcription regulator [Arthrobacter echini]THJ67143.1 DeoR/GlpR transcriptional regulator [Arthrobacter echini]
MEREDRLSRLIDFVIDEGSVHVEKVMERFDVSAATARRDLDSLAAQQLIIRTRGGAMVNSSSGDLPLRYRTVHRWREKASIARKVADLISPGDVVAFNGGTTTTSAAQELGVRVAGDARFDDTLTTVVTNAVNIANDLMVRTQLRIVVTGGVAQGRSYELIGPLASLMLPHICIDTLFLGISALDLEHGLFTHHEGEAAVNAEMAAMARRTVVLADSSKIGTTAFARICRLEEVEVLVTDSGVKDSAVTALEASGVTLIIA